VRLPAATVPVTGSFFKFAEVVRLNSTSYSVPSAFEMSLPFAMLRRLPHKAVGDCFNSLHELFVRPIGDFAHMKLWVNFGEQD
jgi:hypothetical protein